MIEAMAIVHIDRHGNHDFLISGDERFRLFIVDERAPDDRVYEITARVEPKEAGDIIGDSPIGSSHDDRHEAMKARILEASTGKPRLHLVEKDQGDK